MGRTNGLHLCFTAFNVIFSAGGVAMQLPSRSVELHTRTVNRDLCQLWIPTWPWTECQQFVTDYNLTMSNFIDMNPSVAADCYGWVGGTKYCVLMPKARHISTNGACGFGGNVTCIGSTYGNCCGKTGRCGSTDAFCAIGNCQDGICPGLGYTTDGKCGKDNNYLRCGGSFGKCCSNAGVCGSTANECGPGNCQSGECQGTTTTSRTASPTTTPPPQVTAITPSPDGTCGGASRYKCTGTTFFYGGCCGARGFCGYTDWECDERLGCQSEFGLCDKTVTVLAS